MCNKIKRLTVWILVALILGISKPNYGFDTGHHWDLTNYALSAEGFKEDAANMAKAINWFTDFYSTKKPGPDHEAEKLHFDNLFTTKDVDQYWKTFVANTKKACERAVKNKDPEELLTYIGISLHAVQDFYTHSNWVDYFPPSPNDKNTDYPKYQTVTWFDAEARPLDKFVYTGTYPTDRDKNLGIEFHGSYFDGLNKDWYGSPLWVPAYVMAYKASRQWLRAMKEWTNDDKFWESAQNIAFTKDEKDDLWFDLSAAGAVSMWIKYIPPSSPNSYPADPAYVNGKWKGHGSGCIPCFVGIYAYWQSKSTKFTKKFTEQKLHYQISRGLYTKNPHPVIKLPSISLDEQMVVIRTISVKALPADGDKEKLEDSPDFFVKSLLAHTHIEAVQQDSSAISPEWHTIGFFPKDKETIPIIYELWEEGSDEPNILCDINPKEGKQRLEFSFNTSTQELSGDVSGKHNTYATAVTSSGAKPDKYRAEVSFYVYSAPLEDKLSAGGKTLILEIERVEAIDNFDGLFGNADFYAWTTKPSINKTMYIIDKNIILPKWFLRWHLFEKDAPFELIFEIWDADHTWWHTNDDQADISPVKNQKDIRLKVNPKTGEITGDVTGKLGQTFALQGNEGKRAKVTFKVHIKP